jgi:hypothetical protein
MAYVGRKSGNAALIAADIPSNLHLLGSHVKIPSVTTANLPGSGDNSSITPVNGMLVYNTTVGALQQYNGVWSTIAPAPSVTSISGLLNADNDSTITVFGTNFNSSTSVKMFSASSGGTQIGSNATTTFNSSVKLTAVFGAGSIGASGSTAYIEIDNSGSTSRFATAITVNADPTVSHTGATGAGANTTTHLGTYGGFIAGGGADANTTLLLNFDRGGGTDFEDSSNTGGTGHKVGVSADTVIKASPFGDGKSAMYFDSVDGTEIKVPSFNTGTGLGNGAFTIETWVWCELHNSDSANPIIFDTRSGSNGFGLEMNKSTGQLFIWDSVANAAAISVSVSTTLQIKTWTHLAIVRTGTGTPIKLYLNGIEAGASSNNSSDFDSEILTFGRAYNANSANFKGYLDEIRVVVGTAVYTGDFKIPTARFSGSGQSAGASGTNIAAVTAAQTKLLIHSNLSTGGSSYATFTDSATTGTTHTISRTGAFHSTLGSSHAENTIVIPALTFPASGKAFGSVGAYFDGTGDHCNIPDSSDWDFGSAAFTIDFWVYPLALASESSVIVAQYEEWQVQLSHGATGALGWKNSAGTWLTAPSGTVTTNAWQHIAIVRTNTATDGFKMYRNGVLVLTGTDNATYSGDTSDVELGRQAASPHYYYNGYLDNLRICKGVSRYSAAFTPPTTLYGAIASLTIPTITFTGLATQLASDEDIEFTAVENSGKADGSRSFIDTDIGLTLTNVADSNTATLTGTITSDTGTTHTNMPLKLQVRKTLANAAYANASRTVTFSSSTTTIGLAPAMPVSGTGIPASTTITSVDNATTITLSANPTGGALTGQSLVFLDPTRVSHQYAGSDTIDNSDTMYTIATGAGSDPVLFNARRYFGTDADKEISGFGFQPDFLWIKCRTNSQRHVLYDSVRGFSTTLQTESNAAASTNYGNTYSGSHIDNPTVDGFVYDHNGGSGSANLNSGSYAYVAWAWKAGGAPSGTGKRRTDNSSSETSLTTSSSQAKGANVYGNTGAASNISAVKQSVNSAGNFSITTYTSGGSDAGGTNAHHLCHGLSGTPDWFIIKKTDTTSRWAVWHKNLSSASYHLQLDTTDAQATGDQWGNTAPDNTSINLGTNAWSNYNGSYVCYAWKAVAGVSEFGTYEGSGSASTKTVTLTDSTLTPKLLIVKNIDATANWRIYDTFRGTGTAGNTDGEYTNANSTGTNDAGDSIIFGAGQFTMTNTSVDLNAANTYIYMAFA